VMGVHTYLFVVVMMLMYNNRLRLCCLITFTYRIRYMYLNRTWIFYGCRI
jgi:hypothetical protein